MLSRIACLTVGAVLMMSSVAQEPSGASRAGQVATADWVTFKGTAKQAGDRYHLTPEDKNGAIDAPAEAVKVEGDTVKIRVGALVKIAKPAKGTPEASTKPPEGCVRRSCIGQVMICCNTAQVVSSCTGSYSCN